MSKKVVFKSRVEPIFTPSGNVIRINKYIEFRDFIKETKETVFSKHYKLFNNQIGVYKFNVGDKCQHIGYSSNLKDRVRISFFNHCFLLDNVTFQYILYDNKQSAIDIEAHYKRGLNIKDVPEFCKPIRIFFNEWYCTKYSSTFRSEA